MKACLTLITAVLMGACGLVYGNWGPCYTVTDNCSTDINCSSEGATRPLVDLPIVQTGGAHLSGDRCGSKTVNGGGTPVGCGTWQEGDTCPGG